jgi:hypothetical protein
MMKVVVIGCAPSEIISSCQITITSLAKEGHMIYSIIAPSDESERSSLLPVIANVQQLAAIGITQTFLVDRFDYSAITQINADIVKSYIENIRPSLVIMPSWKSPNHIRKILARTSLIACRGIGTILMYELDANNISFNPNVVFEVLVEHSVIQHRVNNAAETTTSDQHEINNMKTFTNNSILEDKRSKTSSYERLEEKFESHRTLLLEEEELF